MPIKPENKNLYPPDWLDIRSRIMTRANNHCEGSPKYPDCRAENYKPHPITGSYVILTIAHVDHNPANCADGNLRAWCQRCHLTHDAKHHARNARKTREDKNGIISLPIN